MRAQIISDIHLEFGNREFDFSGCDLLILAGDIHLGTKGLEWILGKVKNIPVLYILGNHEYYRNTYPGLIHQLKEKASGSNIHILENESVVIEGVSFHCMTLWTDFGLFGNPQLAGFECQQKMNDYYLIRRDPSYSKLRSIDTHTIHNESKKWLEKSLAESNTKTNVVVSHHAPSIRSIALRYKDDLLSAAFASNMEDLILRYQPNLWVHGHVHDAFDYMIGNTRVVCNPLGYPHENPENYKENLIIEINA